MIRSRRNFKSHPIKGAEPPAPHEREIHRLIRYNGNYYLLCLTGNYDAPLLSDFYGDAAILITNPARFGSALHQAVAAVRPELAWHVGGLSYYDPYFHDGSAGWIPLKKHFRYACQREFRIVWTGPSVLLDAEPFFVEIGSMRDYA